MVQQVLVKDVFETYSYFYIDDKTKHGFLIDPGADADGLLQIIDQRGWTVERILLTHGHFDHTGAVDQISKVLHIPYAIHRNGEQYLVDTRMNLSSYCKRSVVLDDAEFFDDGTVIGLDKNPEFTLQIIHTPGHTPDSVVFYNEKDKAAFVGDTIFKGSIGNTKYPGGNMQQLQDSIINKIFRLPSDTRLYSGHSEMTTVGTEIQRYAGGTY